jgi:hypothetical protein
LDAKITDKTYFIKEEETHLKRCFSCKKGTLMTVVLFDKRGPPKNRKRKYQHAVKSRA